jgi:hypothetical protein
MSYSRSVCPVHPHTRGEDTGYLASLTVEPKSSVRPSKSIGSLSGFPNEMNRSFRLPGVLVRAKAESA